MSNKFYPVSSPDIGLLEEQYVGQAVRSGWVSSIGEFVERFEQGFAAYCGSEHGVAMSNGTDALFIALKALGVGPGHEVIVPALTFVAVPAVVRYLGAEPVIVDVHPEHWGLDPQAAERALSSRTRAIVAVHVYGHPADIDPLVELAQPRQILVVEDCAEAHGALYKGQTVGALGTCGCFSFYGNKVITTGEGGMVVTADQGLAQKMRFLKDHAMDPARRYFHPEVGFNCRMTNLQAALGCAQLERIEELLTKRAEILSWYREELADLDVLSFNPHLSWAEPVNWMVCAVLSPHLAPRRDQLLAQLKERGVDTRPFFLPPQKMPPYANCRTVGAQTDTTPIADLLSATGFNLPSSPGLTRRDVERIAAEVRVVVEEKR